jgi:hypothetical protein
MFLQLIVAEKWAWTGTLMLTRTCIPKGTPKGSSDLWKHPVLLLRKKCGKKPVMRITYFRSGTLPDRASSIHVTLSLPIKRPH